MGINLARGDVLVFLDDEDELLPPYLAEMEERFCSANSQVGFAWGGVRRVVDTPHGERCLAEELWTPEFASREDAFLCMVRDRHIGASGLAVRADAIRHVGGFDEAMRSAEDTDLLIRLPRLFDHGVVRRTILVVHRRGA